MVIVIMSEEVKKGVLLNLFREICKTKIKQKFINVHLIMNYKSLAIQIKNSYLLDSFNMET